MTNVELRDDRSEKIYYSFEHFPVYIKMGLLSTYNGYAAPPHWHDDVEFIRVLRGEMQYNVNGEVVTLGEGQGIFVNSKALHFGFSDKHRECEFICILLHPSMLCLSPETEQEFVLPVLHNRDAVFIKLNAEVLWQKAILDAASEIYRVRTERSAPLTVNGLFFGIWANIFENIPCDSADETNADLPLIRNMVGFIQQNYHRKITLDDIANAGYVGQSKCCKLFREYIGQTPINYLTQYRLNKGLQMLQNTDLPITEIALSAGFNGNSYFAEAFRKTYGKTPSEARNDKNLLK